MGRCEAVDHKAGSASVQTSLWMFDRRIRGLWPPRLGHTVLSFCSHPPQAVEAAQLAEDLKVQLEHVQTRLREIQPCLAESRAAREKESFNLKRAQVCAWGGPVGYQCRRHAGMQVLSLASSDLGGYFPAAAQTGEAKEGGGLCRC